MSLITTIAAGDNISTSRTDINTNFANLNTDKIETSYIDTDTALAANSDVKIPSQKAIKAYVDAGGAANRTGQTTHDSSLTASTTIAHGLGTNPRLIKITAMGGQNTGALGMSVGTYNGTTHSTIYSTIASGTGTASIAGVSSVYIIYLESTQTGDISRAVATFDGTNITLTWSKVGSPTGTASILWEAFS